MAIYFLDTSAVIKRYVQEAGTAWVQALTQPGTPNSHFVARITWVETLSAVTRRENDGNISPPDAAIAIRDFQQDFDTPR